MEKVNKDPFSNGTELSWWTGRNCDKCIKTPHYLKPLDGYTRCRCAIYRDIAFRMFSDIPIARRTIDVCSKADCPYRLEHYPKKKNKPSAADNQLTLF